MIINHRNAMTAINSMLALDNDYSDLSITLRALLIDDDATDLPAADFAPLLLAAIRELDTHSLSMLRLDFSLCPLHAIDYAICFDDDDPDCAAIRAAFPNHDT